MLPAILLWYFGAALAFYFYILCYCHGLGGFESLLCLLSASVVIWVISGASYLVSWFLSVTVFFSADWRVFQFALRRLPSVVGRCLLSLFLWCSAARCDGLTDCVLSMRSVPAAHFMNAAPFLGQFSRVLVHARWRHGGLPRARAILHAGLAI